MRNSSDRKPKPISDYDTIADGRPGACYECSNRSFPIHRSAAVGHVDCMKRQFANLHNPDILLDQTNSTPLHAAASAGQTESLKFLLQYTRIPVHHRNNSGETCCHLAALNHHSECLKILLGGSFRKAQSIAFQKDVLGCTILHCAVASGDNDIALWLLQRFGKSLANIANNDDVLPLHAAAGQGNIEFIRISTKYDSHIVNKRDRNGASPAFYAVQNGHLICLKYLFDKAKADIRSATRRGQSLIHAACLNGHSDIVQWLFSKLDKAYVCQQTRDSATPFHYAAYGGHESILKFLHKISGGKKLLILLTDKVGNTALHLASLKGHKRCVEYLLTLGADPEVRNKSGYTPLDVALKRKHSEVVEILQAAIEDNQGQGIMNLTADEFVLRNSIRLVRPHSMSTSGYSSTAATSEAYEIAADPPKHRKHRETSSSYPSPSRIKTPKRTRHREKTIEYNDTVLSRENWLLKRKRDLIYHNHLFEIDDDDDDPNPIDDDDDDDNDDDDGKLIDRKIQTDFDPLVDDIMVVDDHDRVIFESGSVAQRRILTAPGNISSDSTTTTTTTTTTDSLESCFEPKKDVKRRQKRARDNKTDRISRSTDKSSSNYSDFVEQADSDLQDTKSVDSSRLIGFNNVYENECYNPASRIDDILRNEAEDEESSSDKASARTKSTVVVAMVHQRSVERITIRPDGRNSIVQKTGCAVVAQATIIDKSKVTECPNDGQNEPSLSLPFVYEPVGSSDDGIVSPPAVANDADDTESNDLSSSINVDNAMSNDSRQKSSNVNNNNNSCSVKSISLTDLSGLGSPLGHTHGITTNSINDSIDKKFRNETESMYQQKSRYEIPNSNCWKPPPRQQLSNDPDYLPPLLAEMRRCSNNSPAFISTNESKTVRFKPSVIDCPSPIIDRRPVNKVAEIRKRLEEQFAVAMRQKIDDAKRNLHNEDKRPEKSPIDDQSIDSSNYRYFGVSNASDQDLRRKPAPNAAVSIDDKNCDKKSIVKNCRSSLANNDDIKAGPMTPSIGALVDYCV